MKVTIPGFVAPIAGARLEINGRIVFLRPRDKAPIFEVGAKELRGIEHLMGPLTVDFPAPTRPQRVKAPTKMMAAPPVLVVPDTPPDQPAPGEPAPDGDAEPETQPASAEPAPEGESGATAAAGDVGSAQ